MIAMLQSVSSSPLDSSHDLGQPPADEREAGSQAAIQPLHDEALGHREHVVIDRVPHADTAQYMEASEACMEVVSISASKTLNPDAENFVMKDATLLHGGRLRPDLDQDL